MFVHQLGAMLPTSFFFGMEGTIGKPDLAFLVQEEESCGQ